MQKVKQTENDTTRSEGGSCGGGRRTVAAVGAEDNVLAVGGEESNLEAAAAAGTACAMGEDDGEGVEVQVILDDVTSVTPDSTMWLRTMYCMMAVHNFFPVLYCSVYQVGIKF